MDLDFSEEQDVLREMVRGLCSQVATIEIVRAMEDDPKGYTDELWKQLGELGLLGVVVPEAYGGADQSLLDAVIVHEELGRALAPSPAFVSSIVAARALLQAGSVDQKEAWLPRIVSGDVILSEAWLEPGNGFGPKGVQLRAERVGGDWILQGEKRLVAFAASASQLIVLARTGDGKEDIGLFLVDPKIGVSMTQTKSLASDTHYDLRFDRTPGEPIGGPLEGWSSWEAVMHEAIIVLAAVANGGCERALEMTAQYAKDRKQFDKPIGAFQAISHYLADALTHLDGSKTLCYEAAWTHAQGRDLARLAPMAKLFACDTYRDTTAKCQQIWGGVGFSVEYDIQLYFRRAKQLQMTWWDSRNLEERIAAAVLDRS